MRALLVGIIVLLAPTLCWAQAREVPLYIGPFPTPQGFRLGNLDIFPRIDNWFVYDDNIFLDEIDEEPDTIYHLRPDVHARLNLGANHDLEFGGRADITDYSDNEQENSTDHIFDGAVHLNFNRVTFSIMEYFSDDTVPSSSALESDIGPRVRHDDNELVSVVGFLLGDKARIEFDSRYFFTRFDDSDLKRLDLDELGGGASFFWRIASKTNVFVGYEYTEVTFDDISKLDPQDDSENHVIMGGLEFEPGGKLIGHLSGGAQIRDFESLEDRTVPAASTDVTWFATPKLTFTVRVSRLLEDSSSSSDEFIEASEALGSVLYQLTDRLAVRLTGQYNNNDYNTNREENRGRGVAEIAYFVIRDKVRLSAKYERIDNDSTVESDDYDVNRGSLEVLLQY